jgi:peptidoglycan/xylan/chitin deacetylase (PgdA/CDA1 family)
MNKRLLLLLSISLFFLIFYPEQNIVAVSMDNSADYYLGETGNPETFLRDGADDQSKVKTTISENQKFVVIGEFLNSKNEQWLHVQYNDSIGWIKNEGLKKLEIKGQFLTSSWATTPIRRGALTTYKQIGVLQKGQIVKPIDGFTNSNGDRWIRFTNGKVTGWSPLSSMELFNGGKNYKNNQLFIKKDVEVRSGASLSTKGVYLIKKGTQVTIQSSIIANNVTWYRIMDGEKSGWIPASEAANQLTLSTYLFANNKSATVYNGASSSYSVVSTLTIGQRVETTTKIINGEKEIWYKVILGNGKSGWVLGGSLSTKTLKIAYLTIDDGPTIYTSKLLDTLNKYHAKATFFMLNGNMNAHPSDVKRMLKEGNAMGSHSVTHDKSKFYRSPSSAVNEMMTTRNTIIKITGVNSNLMRVPYGSVPYMKQSYRDATNKQHFIMWDWNVDSLDWKFNSSSYVNYTLNQVKTLEKKGTVPVILIHDHKATLDSLPSLLSALENLGYTLAPLSESIKPYQFRVSN